MVGNIDYEKVVNFGAFNYSAHKMAAILLMEESEVLSLLEDKKSEFYKHYQKGVHTSDYVLDMKLFEMAQGGDLKAMENYEFRKRKRNK